VSLSHYIILLSISLIAVLSPGPATIAIASTSMNFGKKAGQTLAAGISIGSITWALSAALGLSALMLTHSWVVEVVRYCGASYLIFLGYQSAKRALNVKNETVSFDAGVNKPSSWFTKGIAIHLTNPKPIIFFGSLFSVGVPVNTAFSEMLLVSFLVVLQGFIMFQLYAILFSRPTVRSAYFRMKRGFETAFAVVFGTAGLSLLVAKFDT
jgi:threonine/homoserine/homoserine lactone efflux protein